MGGITTFSSSAPSVFLPVSAGGTGVAGDYTAAGTSLLSAASAPINPRIMALSSSPVGSEERDTARISGSRGSIRAIAAPATKALRYTQLAYRRNTAP